MKNKRIIIIGIVVVIIIGIRIAVAINKQGKEGTMTKEEAGRKSIYSDRENTLKIVGPSGWSNTESNGNITTGLGTKRERKEKLEVITIGGEKYIGMNIQIYTGKPDCKEIKKTNTQVGELPAYYEGRYNNWYVYTEDATYVLSYGYPGKGIYHGRYQPKALGKEEAARYEGIFREMLHSFKPKNPLPPKC